ncbi:hypothetical protein [Actinacidiphila soli]|uniref:hypothetical protein n=1 Tax=Actinacidiphila soli TaxID=2487275 RepID=UPI001F0B9EA0|nr:hypothetical protein [Actinacidiphila soli]
MFRTTLQGYLLEEALAWLLRNSGYRLLNSVKDDPDELTTSRDGSLRVRGRGSHHQVDVLGEFTFTPAFSLPVRMFLESKFTTGKIGLATVRNAHGVIHDVNQNFTLTIPTRRRSATDPIHRGRPRRRFHYVYALFSASGFTSDAQRYALAHQISLVDLSGPSFHWLRTAVRDVAKEITGPQGTVELRIADLRSVLRMHLRTADWPGGEHELSDDIEALLRQFARSLMANSQAELLLGFPAAPFILPMATTDAHRFLAYTTATPTHTIRLRRNGHHANAEWSASPWDADEDEGYQLTFKLPRHIEDWISDIEEDERLRIRRVKEQFLPAITVYRTRPAGGVDTYQLLYDPTPLRNQ